MRFANIGNAKSFSSAYAGGKIPKAIGNFVEIHVTVGADKEIVDGIATQVTSANFKTELATKLAANVHWTVLESTDFTISSVSRAAVDISPSHHELSSAYDGLSSVATSGILTELGALSQASRTETVDDAT